MYRGIGSIYRYNTLLDCPIKKRSEQMDIGLSLQERNNKYFYAMAKIEADKLINLSRRVSFNNIKDVFLRVKFENDIK